MNIYILRHGETNGNKAGRIQGSTDIPLNEYGIELAKITRDGIEKRDFNLILFMQVRYQEPVKRLRSSVVHIQPKSSLMTGSLR